MGSNAARHEPDVTCVRSIFGAWRALRRQYQPRQPVMLMRLLRDSYQFPHQEFLPLHGSPKAIHAKVDAAYAKLQRAAHALSAAIPQDDNWHVLASLMESRSRPADADKNSRDFQEIERIAHLVARQELEPRPKSTRGRPVTEIELRLITQAVCWYVIRVECLPVRSSVDDTKSPRSRVARIIEATCIGMSIEATGAAIMNQINNLKKLDLKAVEWWDLTTVLPASQ